MLKNLALFTILLSFVASQCSEGCIICDKSKNKCRYCDSSLNYIIQSGVCVRASLKNCQNMGSNGTCLKCQADFFLDNNTGRCLPVHVGKSVSNCAAYSHRGHCVSCTTRYYLVNDNCAPVAVSIPNCDVYASERECQVCANGYILNTDATACITSESSNCAGFSQIDCLGCVKGYIRNPNSYIYEVSSPGPIQSISLERFMMLSYGVAQNARFPICQAYKAPNCVEFVSFNTCRICAAGFYLSDGQCFPNPISRIPYCVRYSGPTTCIECEKNMYIKGPQECATPGILVTNCALYNTTATFISCIRCEEGYFISEPNVCSKRTALSEIQNCDTISLYGETCAICKAGFILTTDGGACLPSLPNCLNYQVSSRSSVNMLCQKCTEKYYYDLNLATCVKGTKDYCVEYSLNANSCVRCFNKFYAINGVCKPHDELYLCDKYDVREKNRCSECKSSAFLFTRQDSCVPVTPIDYCLKYATVSTCALCEDNYMLTPSGKCELIPIKEFCMQKNSAGQCIKCHSNYVLDNGVCNNFDDEMLFFCASHNLNGLISSSQLSCGYCKSNSLPMNYKDFYSCVHESILPANVLNIRDCQQFDGSTGTCTMCAPTHVLSEGQCILDCESTLNTKTLYLQILSPIDLNNDAKTDRYQIVSTRTCYLTIPNCQIAAPSLNQGDGSLLRYACVKCKPGFVPRLDSLSSSSYRTSEFSNEVRNTPVTFQPGFECTDPATTSYIMPSVRPLINNAVEMCDYYAQISHWLGCVKCKHGYSGVIINNVFACQDYDSENLCLRCRHGFWLESRKKCTPVTPVPDCEQYYREDKNKCILCRSHFKLTDVETATNLKGETVKLGAKCARRTTFSLNCLKYATDSDDCVDCREGFKLNASKQCQPYPPFCTTMNDAGDCTACRDDFYLQNKVCFKGEVDFCKTYSEATTAPAVAPNTCSACYKGYYLSTGKCLPHHPMANCETTSPDTKNVCNTCAPSHFRFKVQTKCDPYIPVANCIEYDSVYTCKKCQDGYYIANKGQRCIQIPSTSGCTVVETDNCTKCKPNYFLKSGACVNWFTDVLKNCDLTLGITYTPQPTVQKCGFCLNTTGSNIEPIEVTNSYRCIETEAINAHKPLISKCKKYSYIDPNLECITCEAPYVLAEDRLSCITAADCFAATKSVYLAIYESGNGNIGVRKVNDALCKAPPANEAVYFLTNCYLAASIVQSDASATITYYCAKCQSGYVGRIHTEAAAADDFKFVNQKNIGEKVSQYTFYTAIVECKDPTTVVTWRSTVNLKKQVSSCEYYTSLATDEWGCYKCSWGFGGVVNALGYIEKCEPIEGCKTSTYMENISSDPLTERKVRLATFSLHFNCHSCEAVNARPTVFIKGLSPFTGILGYESYKQSTNTYVLEPATYTGWDIKCEDPTVSNSPMSGKFTVENCALYVVSTQALTAAKCVACNSGFVPKRNADASAFIDQCSSSANIVASTPPVFNGGQCLAGTAYFYSFSGGVSYSACNTHPDTLCFAANSPNSRCDVCRGDAVYNSNTMKCEKTIVPYCSSVSTSEFQLKSLGRVAFYLTANVGECDACEGSRVPIKKPNVFGDEAAVTYFVCGVKTPPSTPVIPTKDNCLVVRYNLQNKQYECTVCKPGWIITEDGECADAALNANCSLVTKKSGSFCSNCISNTISQAGKCVARSIVNCDEYVDSSYMSYIRCKWCKDNFYEKFDLLLKVSTCEDASTLRIYNCARYKTFADDENNPTVFYVKCDTCAAGFMLVKTDDSNTPVCHPIGLEVPDCQVFDFDETASSKMKCTKCLASSSKVPVTLRAEDQRDVCIKYVGDPKCIKWVFAPTSATYQPKVVDFVCEQCVDDYYYDIVNKYCTKRTYIFSGNCKTLNFKDDKCEVCVENFYINPAKTACIPTPGVKSSPSLFSGFLSACSPMDSCLSDTLEGLPVQLSSYISCHKCADAAKIPFLVVRGGYPYSGIQGLVSYSLTLPNILLGYDMGSYGESTICVEPIASTFSIPANQFAFPDNCAVGVLNANSVPDASHSKTVNGPDLKKVAAFCGACSPGFKAVPAIVTLNNVVSTVPNMIARCETISNCESSTWFNYCSQCMSGYSYSWSSTTGIQFDSCISNNNNKDCYAYDPVENACVMCNRRTYLNADKYCERRRQPRCEANGFLQSYTYIAQDLAAGLVLNREVVGCTKCEPGYKPLLRKTDYFICTESSYHAKGLATATSKFIFNCKNYSVDSNFLLSCQVCKNGFIPKSPNNSCIEANSLPNCKVAIDSVTCKECVAGSVLVNRICVLQSLQNCILYGNNDQSTEQMCIGCAEGYYLEANHCKLGNVNNCLIYETKTRCNKCKPNYQLVIRDDGANYCYPVDPQLKCKSYDDIEFQKGNLKCTECNSRTLIVSQDSRLYNPNHCLRYTQIRNCVLYDLRKTIASIADSTFGCIKCLRNFYLKEEACIPRTFTSPDCIEYNVADDRCSICKEGMYLSSNGTCVEYPSGIPNCIEYSSPVKCVACDSTTYLANNECVVLLPKNKIANCRIYETEYACKVCDPTFTVQDKNCTKVLASNCLTVKNVYACESCQPNYILKTEGETINCVQGNIENCLIYEIKEPIRCITCKKEFYVKDGVCAPVTTSILRCVEYDSATTCLKCESNTALASNKTACLTNYMVFANIDPYCLNSVVSSSTFCSVCKPSYYLNKGSCVPCSSMLNGCQLCDPQSPNICLVCASSYYMNVKGECIKYSPSAEGLAKVIHY